MYSVEREKSPKPPLRTHRRHHADEERDEGSEIVVLDNYYHGNQDSRFYPQSYPNNMTPTDLYRPPSSSSAISMPGHQYHPGGSVFSETSTVKTSRKGNVLIETMSAPNPCCPNSKGICCLLLLINLGLILLTLGFSIVLQIFQPPFVWYCGILFVLTGFIALISSLIFCVHICRENNENNQLYWTHHWQKKISIPQPFNK